MIAAPGRTVRAWPATASLPACQVGLQAATDLQLRVLEGVKALPRRGLEIGGLLLGAVNDGVVTIDHLEPVASEYPDGPVWRVEDADLRAAVESVRPKGIVGMYRSRTDGVLDVEEQDITLLRLLEGEHPPVVLIVGQTKKTPPELRLGHWRDGEVRWSDPARDYSEWMGFAPAAEAPEARAIVGPVAALPPAVRSFPLPAVAHTLPPQIPTAQVPSGRSPAWFGGAVGAVAVLGVFATVFSVNRLNRMIFGPAPAPAVSERSQPPPAQQPSQPTPAPPAVAVSTAGVPQASFAPPPEPELELSPAVREAPERAERSRTVVRRFRPPLQRRAVPRPAPRPVITTAPDLPVPGGDGGPGILPQNTITRPPASAQVIPAPAGAPVALVEFAPPVLARQGSAVVIPPDIRRVLKSEVTLSLRVGVDASGRVTNVVPTSRLGAVEQSLLRSYTDALRTWVFQPARRDGRPVAGEAILTFRISPDFAAR